MRRRIMNKVKIFIAVMIAIAIVQSHASDGLSQQRTDSSERRRRLSSGESNPLLKGQNDLSTVIKKLQDSSMNQFFNTVKSNQETGSSRYQATSNLLTTLAGQRKVLDSQEVVDQEIMVEIAQSVYGKLREYGEGDSKVTFIANSEEFKNLKKYSLSLTSQK